MAVWQIEDRTTPRGGYLALRRNGVRICDFFPFAAGPPAADENFIRRQAAMIAALLNEHEPQNTPEGGQQ